MHNFAYNLTSHASQIQRGGEKNAGGGRLEGKELLK